MAERLGQLDRTIAAGEVLLVVPDADQFLVVGLVPPGPVGEEAARLARPREVGDLGVDQPLLEVGVDAVTQPAQIGSSISARAKLFDSAMGLVLPVFSA